MVSFPSEREGPFPAVFIFVRESWVLEGGNGFVSGLVSIRFLFRGPRGVKKETRSLRTATIAGGKGGKSSREDREGGEERPLSYSFALFAFFARH